MNNDWKNEKEFYLFWYFFNMIFIYSIISLDFIFIFSNLIFSIYLWFFNIYFEIFFDIFLDILFNIFLFFF